MRAPASWVPTHDEDERNRRYAAADIRRYLTTAPSLAEPATAASSKDEWWRSMDEAGHRITMPHRPLRP
jgi:hypothetical protein